MSRACVRTLRAILVVLCLGIFGAPLALAGNSPFPRPAALEPDIEFWLRIYSEVDTHGGLVHDSRHLDIVYQVLDLPDNSSASALNKQSGKARDSITTALRSLARGKRQNLSSSEKRVLAQWPKGVSNSTLRDAARRVRFQLGQADKFKAGLIRSGRWEPHIRETLREMGLPPELSALPHVESSYNPSAYSRVGAAGLWQFTRSTGKRFMRVDHVVDERLDPYKASVAAAQLLQQNRKVTGTWPLAITAYNHGASGMRRAVRNVGTSDIEKIVRTYKSRTFGFASRNFYLEFLAALEVDLHSEKYFGRLVLDTPVRYETASLPFYASVNTLQRHLGVSLNTLQRNNPALRPAVWEGEKHVPKGFTIRIPLDELSRPLNTAIKAVSRSQRFTSQTRDRTYTVRRGDSISLIASRYKISQRQLIELNGLRNRHRIRIGQKLRLPSDRRSVVAATPRAPLSPPANGLYTVQRGDTLSRIAARYGMPLNELLALNTLSNKNRIHVGQPIRLASSAASPTRPKPSKANKASKPPTASASRKADRPVVETVAPGKPANAVTAVAVDLMARASSVLTQADLDALAAPAERDADAFWQETDGNPLLPADPSDYSVAGDDTIEVQVEETLGHYAEWLNTRASRLRSINGMSYGKPLAIGKRIELDFAKATREQFEARRVQHHRTLQGEFFDRFEIAGTSIHVARRGESLWLLAQKKYRVPLWLLRQHNPDLSLQDLRAGTRITIPKLKPHTPTEPNGATTAGLGLQNS